MKNKKTPMRRCVGCMESKPKEDLIRIASHEGKAMVDLTGRAKGRGIYLCKSSESCIENARKRKAISRGLKIEINTEDLEAIFEQIADCEE